MPNNAQSQSKIEIYIPTVYYVNTESDRVYATVLTQKWRYNYRPSFYR